MQRNLTSTIAAPKQGRKLSPVVIGGAALVLAAAAGLATWQGIAQRETSAPVTESSVVAVAPPTAQPASATSLSADMTVYIVASQAEATRVKDMIADGDRLLAQFGQPPFTAQVAVVTSAEEDAAVRQAYADADAIRHSIGLPPISLIDLRGQ